MPDQLNKQTLINLLIDSPLREPIKINLIDIANNTSDPDLPKIYPTIVKELEIFQKATERRVKLADETIQKLGGSAPSAEPTTPVSTPPTSVEPTLPPAPATPVVPPTPPLAAPPVPSTPEPAPIAPSAAAGLPPLSVPPLDLPPLPQVPPAPAPAPTPTVAEPSLPPAPPIPPTTTNELPPLQTLGNNTTGSSDEDALAEIQKELESLKTGISQDANPTPPPPAPTTPAPQS